jgi:hypothetical protein
MSVYTIKPMSDLNASTGTRIITHSEHITEYSDSSGTFTCHTCETQWVPDEDYVKPMTIKDLEDLIERFATTEGVTEDTEIWFWDDHFGSMVNLSFMVDTTSFKVPTVVGYGH